MSIGKWAVTPEPPTAGTIELTKDFYMYGGEYNSNSLHACILSRPEKI
jgi:hypothetical protein